MVETMKERLERLKAKPIRVREPLTRDELSPNPSRALLTPESVYMKKVEKVMKNHAETKRKMLSDSGQYLSLYYELKKAEDDFLALLSDHEVKFLDLPDAFLQKVMTMKEKILARRN